MNLAEFRDQMRTRRDDADKRAVDAKESNLAWEWLCDMYRKFDAQEREMANQVLVEWLSSADDNLRYDALVLIDEYHIHTALPALETLSLRLSMSKSPSALPELAKVTHVIERLVAACITNNPK